MRVLAITNLYPRPGAETIASFNRAQFKALAVEHQVRVVAPIAWPQMLREWMASRPSPRHYRNRDGLHVDHPCYLFPPRVMRHRYGAYFLASIRRTVERAVHQFRPDVLLGCWAHPDGWATVQLAAHLGLPSVVKVHGTDVLITVKDSRRRQRIIEGLRNANAVIAVSDNLAAQVVELGIPRQRVHVVSNGIDDALFTPGDQQVSRSRLELTARGKIVLFVGNLLFSKGAAVLIDACAKLRQIEPSLHCVLVGGGRDRETLVAHAERLEMSQVITFAGPQSQDRLPDWYRAANVVALPSFSEGVPNVLREAMMCGRRFVATQVGGIPEIAGSDVGRMVPPGDADALSAALAAELSSPQEVSPAAARKRNTTWAASAARLVEVLQHAIREHAGERGWRVPA